MRGPLPGITSFSGQREMNCDDWPKDMSLIELKSLLRHAAYTNIGLDCNVTHSNRVCLLCLCQSLSHLPLDKHLISFPVYSIKKI